MPHAEFPGYCTPGVPVFPAANTNETPMSNDFLSAVSTLATFAVPPPNEPLYTTNLPLFIAAWSAANSLLTAVATHAKLPEPDAERICTGFHSTSPY